MSDSKRGRSIAWVLIAVVVFSARVVVAQEATKPPDWKKTNRTVTVKGCLETSDTGAFTLTSSNTQMPAAQGQGDLQPAATTTFLIYTLLPNGKKLKDYTNQHVEIRGRIEGEHDMALEIRPAVIPGAAPDTTSTPPHPDTEARLTVLKIKKLSNTCPS